MTLLTTIETLESNYGHGPHTEWEREGRLAWHRWYERETQTPCPCTCTTD